MRPISNHLPTPPALNGEKNDIEEQLRNKVAQLSQKIEELEIIKRDYSEVIEHATEIIFKLNAEGYFYFVSAEFQRALGFTNEQMSGTHFTSIIHPDDLEICLESISQLLQFGKAEDNVVFRVRHIEGQYRWVNCSAVCLFDADGKPTHMIGFAHDITPMQTVLENLRESEKALRISEERYRSLFDGLAEGAVLISNEGTIIASNRSAEKIFDATKEEIMNFNSFRSERSFFYEDKSNFPLHKHPSFITLQTGQSLKNVILGLNRKDGSECWITINTEPIYYSDNREKPDAVVASFVDITQTRTDKAELLKNQQLLALENERYIQATRAVAQAVVDAQEKERADIGHELHDNVNQILSTARLYLDLARNDEKERISLIERSAKSIANAVSEIRNITRSLVPVSISDLGLIPSIDDLVESIQSTKTLNVEFYHEGNIEQVVSDKRKLMLFRIIQEQVTNVMKHAEASKLVIEIVIDNQFVNLSISDDGKGFDKEKIKTKKGVGLHNIANRAELFNGKVNMVTSPGKGCKLNVLVPL